MRFRAKTSSVLLFAFWISPCALSHAQENRSVRKPSKKRPAPASREEVEALRSEVAAQRQATEELRAMVQRLSESNRQAAAAAESAEVKAGQAGVAAKEAQDASSRAENAAGHAKRMAECGQSDLVEVRKAVQANTETLRKNVPANALEAGWNGEHFFLKKSDGSFDLEPIGYLQLDQRSYSGTATPPSTFAIRRGRFGFQGNLGQHYQFTLLADFADTASTLPREFSLNVNYLPQLQLKFGQFKEPFSQEELLGAPYIDFVERSLVRNLVPAYSLGFQVHGQFLRGAVQYQLGAFNGRGFLKLNDTSTPESVLRLRFSPWRNTSNQWLKGLGFGGAVTDGRSRKGNSFTGAMQDATFTFFKAEPVNGPVLRANGELSWIKGPAALRAEYDQTHQKRVGLGPSNTNLPGVVAKGYYVSATYLLTGEKRPENGQPVPRHSFLAKESSGLGAWELKFLYSNLQMEDGTLRSRADQFSTGLNWYPSAFVRYMIDFSVERSKNPISSPVSLAPQSFVSVLHRVQFRF